MFEIGPCRVHDGLVNALGKRIFLGLVGVLLRY